VADVDHLGPVACLGEEVPRDQMIVDDDVGGAKALETVDGNQPGVARPGTDEGDQRAVNARLASAHG
jgi:hypothetical protein